MAEGLLNMEGVVEQNTWLRDLVGKLQAQVEALQAQLDVLQKALAERDAQILELTARLNQNSQNSSRPPSSDAPWLKRKKKKKSGLKAGGQLGHPGASRKRAAAEEVNERVKVGIEGPCPRCGENGLCSSRFTSHQVYEIPAIQPHIIEYLLEKARCVVCKKRRKAKLPVGVSSGILGPRVQALISSLTGEYHMSRRQAERFLRDVCGLRISLGTVSDTEQKVSAGLQQPYQEVLEATRQAQVLNGDETPHKHKGALCWSWVLSCLESVVYQVGSKRSKEAFTSFVGPDFKGVLISDRYGAYSHLPASLHQYCWAHFLRAFQAIAEKPDEIGEIGKLLVQQTQEMFGHWKAYKESKITQGEMAEKIDLIRMHMNALLGKHWEKPDLRGWAHVFFLQEKKVWNFVHLPGVEPTNNEAERALRGLVLWRKRSFGTQSVRGDRFMERILTFAQTCKKQKHPVFNKLIEVMQCAHLGKPPPALLSTANPTH